MAPVRNIWLIARREFVERGKTGAYLVSTLFMMAVLLGSTLLPAYLQQRDKTQALEVVLLDRTGQVSGPLQQAVAAAAKAQEQAGQPVQKVTLQVESGDESTFVEKARTGGTPVLVVEGTFPTAVKARLLSSNVSTLGSAGAVLGPLEQIVRAARIAERKIDPAVAGEILRPMQVETKHLAADGGERDREKFNQSVTTVIGFVMMIYLVLIMNGSFVFSGVLEEKISRVVEVMASAVKPSEMLAGKILGLGSLGLVQFFGMAATWVGGTVWAASVTHMPPETPSVGVVLLALLLLTLGYLLFASLMAGAASTLSRMEDSQTLLMPITMLIAIPMMFLTSVISDPNGSTAVLLSLIPFSAPLIMLVRVMLGTVPPWQLALSLGLLVAGTYLCIRIGARVYRAAMLVHGSRPSMKQLWGYLRAG